MIVVKNHECYHIQRLIHPNKEWFKGEVYTIGLEYNNFYKGIINNLGYLNQNINENNLLVKKIDNYLESYKLPELKDNHTSYFECTNKLRDLKCLVKDAQISLRQYIKYIQENIFEEVRFKHFKNFPSRQKCLYVTTYHDINNWIEIFKNYQYKILKIKITGKLHKTSGIFIDTDTHPLVNFYERARKYWLGEIKNNDEIEYLFCGKLYIVEEYLSIDELNKCNST